MSQKHGPLYPDLQIQRLPSARCFSAWISFTIAAYLLVIGASHRLYGQVPGVCFAGNSPSHATAEDRESFQRMQEMEQTQLVEYLRGLGYVGQVLENAIDQAPATSNYTNPSQLQNATDTTAAVMRSTRPASKQATLSRSWIPHSVRGTSASLTSQSTDLPPIGQGPLPSDDPLASLGPERSQEQQRLERRKEVDPSNSSTSALDPHAEVFANTLYPSANQCAKCHQKLYDEWRVSSHAYASVSPMFQRFEQTVQDLTRGTVGTFCMRCHAPVSTQMNYPRHASLFEGPLVFREGITCVACHRVIERYGRVNGERRIEPGSVYDPVVGNVGGDGVAAVVNDTENWKVSIDPNDKRPRQAMHRGAIQFDQLGDSSFCAACHQVVVQPGIALEIVYQQYRSGPAYKKGITCQDCHMGAVPGVAQGYPSGACAEVSGKVYRTDRKHSNHMFYGPGYPIAHPGIFPHNEKSLRWTAIQWLTFDWRSGWGTDDFERLVLQNSIAFQFPTEWCNAQDRRDARKIVDENLKAINFKRSSSQQILENGSQLDGPRFIETPSINQDLLFDYDVRNISEGHNMPSGSLGAQPQLWLNVVLIGPQGTRLWESGDLDSNGDLRDQHSFDVRKRLIQPDLSLLNLQTKFLTTNLKGTEREMYLPVNLDIDPLPFFRPGPVPYTVLNHPPFIRMEAHSVPPLSSKTARYRVPSQLISQPGTYRISARLRSRVEPPYFVNFVGGTSDMLFGMNEGIIDVHPYSTEFLVR